MKLNRAFKGGALSLIGFLLSPLSWWNDLFVNVPLALILAWCVSWFFPAAFTAVFVAGYWMTNVLGLVLLQKGARTMLADKTTRYSKRDLLKDLAISLVYTLVIIALIKLNILEPIQNYGFGSTRQKTEHIK